jgi:hypothetical protein
VVQDILFLVNLIPKVVFGAFILAAITSELIGFGRKMTG